MGFRGGVLLGVLVWAGCGGVQEPERPVSVEIPAAPGEVPPAVPMELPVQEQLCTRTEYRQDGTLQLRQALGSDGLVREERWYFPDGREGTRRVQQVEAGRVTVRDLFDGAVLRSHQTSVYGERGELLRQESAESWGSRVEEFRYDSQGRLETVEGLSQGVLTQRKRYLYEGALLVRIETRRTDNPSGPGYLFALSAFTHHPNGAMKREEHWTESSMGIRGGSSTDYDERGLPLASESYGDEWGNQTQLTHDSRGLLTRRVTKHASGTGSALREETFAYDEAGRTVLRRLVSDYTNALSGQVTPTRETWRSEYGARGEPVLQTVDLDEDGVADGRRTFTYDSAGRLVEERLEGRAPEAEPGRVVYTWGCEDAAGGS